MFRGSDDSSGCRVSTSDIRQSRPSTRSSLLLSGVETLIVGLGCSLSVLDRQLWAAGVGAAQPGVKPLVAHEEKGKGDAAQGRGELLTHDIIFLPPPTISTRYPSSNSSTYLSAGPRSWMELCERDSLTSWVAPPSQPPREATRLWLRTRVLRDLSFSRPAGSHEEGGGQVWEEG